MAVMLRPEGAAAVAAKWTGEPTGDPLEGEETETPAVPVGAGADVPPTVIFIDRENDWPAVFHPTTTR
jgi:hypothetical protein